MIEITFEQAREAAKLAVAEKGKDFVYDREGRGVHGDCYYVHEDRPGCIVGNILHRLGVPLAELEKHEGKTAWSAIEDLTDSGVASADYRAQMYLRDMQSSQDCGNPWLHSVQYAEDRHPNY